MPELSQPSARPGGPLNSTPALPRPTTRMPISYSYSGDMTNPSAK